MFFFHFVTKHARDGQTVRQTAGQTELRSQDRASVATSRGNKMTMYFIVILTQHKALYGK